ncbi:MAG: dadA [Chthoniobacteraceae bacterium]|nr:dadA [Chthoniobacteraceae bacterium]
MKQVVILGAGIIGLSAAAECVRRGHRVTVIEREPARRNGCSFGNAGMIVPSHFVPLAAPGMVALGLKWMWNPESPFYIKPRLNWDLLLWAARFWRASTPGHVLRAAPLLRDLNLASREHYSSEVEEFGLVKKGLLMLCKTEHALEEEAQMAAKANALGVPAEVLDAKATGRLDPDVTMEIAGSIYFPKDCHLQPERYMAALEKRIRAAGGEFLFETEVTGWKREGGRIAALKTTHGEVEGDEFILAGGSWSQETTRELGLRIPMQAGKGYSVTLPAPVQLPRICAIFAEARVAITPMNGALRFGGTMEIAGLNQTINPRRVEGILKAIPNYYPAFRREHFDGLAPWRGLRPCSPDGLPYIGRTKAASNLIVATGHSMMGVSLAPVTGELTGQLVDNEPPRFPLDLLSPDRYA